MENVLNRIKKPFRELLFLFSVTSLTTINGDVLAQEARFSLPLNCDIGETCFLQNFADLDRDTPFVVDTICGTASYNGHRGIDIRVKDEKALQAGVDILAVASGVVLGTRNTAPDKRITTKADRAAVKGRECGNGLSMRHENGQVTQLCHLSQGSVLVKRGDRVKQGQKIGEMGLSGLTTFPHVHLALRSGPSGQKILDPLTGNPANKNACDIDPLASTNLPFGADQTKALIASSKAVIDLGLAGVPFELARLVEGTAPPVPTSADKATVGWAWLLNVKKGDRVWMGISYNGAKYAENLSKPIEKHKATYFYFTGRSRSPKAGHYEVLVELRREDAVVRKKSRTFTVRD